jgi:hypothetical protein
LAVGPHQPPLTPASFSAGSRSKESEEGSKERRLSHRCDSLDRLAHPQARPPAEAPSPSHLTSILQSPSDSLNGTFGRGSAAFQPPLDLQAAYSLRVTAFRQAVRKFLPRVSFRHSCGASSKAGEAAARRRLSRTGGNGGRLPLLQAVRLARWMVSRGFAGTRRPLSRRGGFPRCGGVRRGVDWTVRSERRRWPKAASNSP